MLGRIIYILEEGTKTTNFSYATTEILTMQGYLILDLNFKCLISDVSTKATEQISFNFLPHFVFGFVTVVFKYLM